MRILSLAIHFATAINMVVPAAIAVIAPIAISQPAEAAERPGPSRALYNTPYYACLKNYYVATNGSDSNNGTSASTPWATLQHANDSNLSAGDCVNVAPGTYASGVLLTSGGNLASRTGYVVYRCSQLDACTVTAVYSNNQNGSFVWKTNNNNQPMTGNYIIIDGFTMTAAQETTYGQGVDLWDGNDSSPSATFSVHHVWILNSIISGYGQSGIQMNDGEYFFVVHNTIFNNSRVGCGAQGSGISFAVLKALNGYVRTQDDSKNHILGAIGTFNNAMEYNILYNNAITGCNSDSDGNNIIADTFNNAGSTNVTYPGNTLIAFNVSFNAGGRGIHIFNSENITVANNTCYNSSLDPNDNGTYRPCIGDLNSYNVNFINNIAYGIPGSGINAYDAAFTGGYLPGGGHALDTFSNNLSYCKTTPQGGCNQMFNGDSFSCTSNQCNTDPQWLSVGTQTVGTETTPPISANFALKLGSPAIGKGLLEPYLPSQSIDVGACSSAFTKCW